MLTGCRDSDWSVAQTETEMSNRLYDELGNRQSQIRRDVTDRSSLTTRHIGEFAAETRQIPANDVINLFGSRPCRQISITLHACLKPMPVIMQTLVVEVAAFSFVLQTETQQWKQ